MNLLCGLSSEDAWSLHNQILEPDVDERNSQAVFCVNEMKLEVIKKDLEKDLTNEMTNKFKELIQNKQAL